MTTVIIVIGVLGAILLGIAAYRNLVGDLPLKQKIRSTASTTPAAPQQPIKTPRRFNWKWLWLWWAIPVTVYLGFAYQFYPWKEKWEELSDEEVRGVLRRIQTNNCPTPVILDQIPSDIFKINVTAKCPATVKVEPYQMMVWWGDKSKFRTGWYFKKREVPIDKITHDKFRVFQARGIDQVVIKIHGYYDLDPLWHTRQ